jgi:hypothetical protein
MSGLFFLTSGGGGAPTNLSYVAATRLLESDTGADVTLPLVSSANAGLAPATGGGTSNFLRADGAWALPPGITNLTYTAATRVLASDTGTDVTLPLFTSSEAGLVPPSGGGTTNFLRADGTFAAPPGGGGGGASLTAVTATLPYGFGTREVTVTDAAVTATSKIVIGWGTVLDSDENTPEEPVVFSAIPATGSFRLLVTPTNDRQPMGGAIKINYLVTA